MFPQLIAALLFLQPQPAPQAPAAQVPTAQTSAPPEVAPQATGPKWVWKLNDAHRYRVERTDRLGQEIITYKLVVRGYEKIPKFHEETGMPNVEYAMVVVTVESVFFKAANATKPDCDTEHPDDADQNSIMGKLYACLKGHKARIMVDDAGHVLAAESNWPVEIAYVQTGDAGSVVDERALGATFDIGGLRARFSEITSTLARAPQGTKVPDDELREPLVEDVSGVYVASKDLEREMAVRGENKEAVTRITACGTLSARGERPAEKLTQSSFERAVEFSAEGYVLSSSGKVRRVFANSEDTLQFKVERKPCPTPEPAYVPKSKREPQ